MNTSSHSVDSIVTVLHEASELGIHGKARQEIRRVYSRIAIRPYNVEARDADAAKAARTYMSKLGETAQLSLSLQLFPEPNYQDEAA